MDINLGPWTAAKTIDAKQRQPLADAMGDEAWNTVKKREKDGFTPVKVEGATPAPSGFTISGQVVQVTKQGTDTKVKLAFTLWVDGTFSNIVSPLEKRQPKGARAPKTPCGRSPRAKSINSWMRSSRAVLPRSIDVAWQD